MIRFSSRRLLSLCTVIVAVFSLALSGPAFLPPADAAEVLRVTAGDGKSFYSYSTRLDLKRAYYLLNIEGGTRPYTFSLTKPFVVVEPSYPGAQVSFKVIPKAVGTTVLTVKDTKGNTMVREIVVYDPGVQPLALGVLPGASNPVAVGQGRGFGVSGGKAPYTVVSANPGIARVEPLHGLGGGSRFDADHRHGRGGCEGAGHGARGHDEAPERLRRCLDPCGRQCLCCSLPIRCNLSTWRRRDSFGKPEQMPWLEDVRYGLSLQKNLLQLEYR